MAFFDILCAFAIAILFAAVGYRPLAYLKMIIGPMLMIPLAMIYVAVEITCRIRNYFGRLVG